MTDHVDLDDETPSAPFRRILSLIDGLPPRFKPSDDRPLREAMPGGWPTIGEFRTFLNSIEPPPPSTHLAMLDPHVQSVLAANNNVIDGLMAENDRLRKMLAGCDWYWPEDDTSSDACADGPWQIAENHDVKPGEVFGYSRGGVVETRYYGFLEAAEDADSDDQFEADEPTREAAEARIAAELKRRAALATTEGKP